MIYDAYGVGGLTARNVDAGQPSPGERHHDQRNEWRGHLAAGPASSRPNDTVGQCCWSGRPKAQDPLSAETSGFFSFHGPYSRVQSQTFHLSWMNSGVHVCLCT